jgi:hypothetical protein
VKTKNIGGIGDGSGRVHGDEAREGHARHAERGELFALGDRSFGAIGIRPRGLVFARVIDPWELRHREPLAGEVAGNLEFAGDRGVGLWQIPGSNPRDVSRRGREGEERSEAKNDALKRHCQG